ncbi:MAG: hypothetical protein A2044_05405 [Candidatus Firestonebacteria bacterium GWA2_43_8]|nr:MAG: hypothetical protein A2044_05405 [Candidatus Firestonebacteria bacterium GWA2_43_8]
MPEYSLKQYFGKNGFVTDWLICGPFPNETKPNANPSAFDPKYSKYWDKEWVNIRDIKPKTGLKVRGPGNFERKWTPLHIKYYHLLEIYRYYALFPKLAEYLDKNCKSKCWNEWDATTYLAVYIEVKKEEEVKLSIGAWDGFKLWVNGSLLGEEHSYHHELVDHKQYNTEFNKGLNLILIKTDRRKVCLRVTTSEDLPLKNARVVLPGEKKDGITLGENFLHPTDAFRKIAYDIKPKMSAPFAGKKNILAWQKKFRKKLIELALPNGRPKGNLNVKILEKVDEGSYIREKILYSREGSFAKVPAYVLVPKKPHGGAMVCLHGHNIGRDCGKRGPAGVYLNEYEKKQIRTDNYDYAKQFAEKGYVTITPDVLGFGERYEGGRFYGGDACSVINLALNLTGENLFGQSVSDYIGAVDYISKRHEVDPKKIGCVGLSFGGTSTYLLSAIDERIKVAIVSCAVTSFREYLQVYGGCGSQTIPGVLKYGDISDICGLIAPRPLLVESGRSDSCFSILFAEEAYAKLKKIYAGLGAAELVDADFFEGGHKFSGAKAFAWVAKANK